MNTLPKYEIYKDSGTPWLEEVPDKWLCLRGKFVFNNKKVVNTKMQCENLLALTLSGVINKDMDSGEGLRPESYTTYQLFEKDNLVFKLIDLENYQTSRVGLVHEDGIMSPVYIRLIAGNKYPVHAKYFYYLYYSYYLRGVYNTIGAGVRSALTSNDLLEMEICIPEIETQKHIADFLDQKTAEIEEAIAKKQHLIELLEERKAILINQAVKKGLNPVAPVKDSGVEWIGEIPKHWGISRSKWLFTQRKETARDIDIQLSATQAYGVISQEKYMKLEGRRVTQITQHLEKRKHVEIDDFVISMRSFQGGLERVWETGCIRSSYVVLEPSPKINVDFFAYLFKSSSYIEALRATANFIRDGQDLNFNNFCLVDLPLIPFDEQKKIADYLTEKIKNLASTAKQIQQEIELLREYKTVLISEAATGKIKI